MPSLMKFLAITLAVLFTTTNAANAWYFRDANPSSVGSIRVVLEDTAQDACWTNLRQAREYAEEKLEIERYDVVAELSEYQFYISVLAYRDSRGKCVGYVEVSIFAGNSLNDVYGLHYIGLTANLSVQSDNFNNRVIETISEMVAKM